ncbi:MAG: hypothetical protein JOY69_03090 [Candidatus Eremiobacteraeota bacterium]|nr:hypothetical protein [Candidatus Eremiobacteraeota bacterium]MBV8372221.1 hypothetical protein [Candidatus Eremiobacteraeota bacterium]
MASIVFGVGSVAAYPISPSPAPTASASPTPLPAGNSIPFDSNLVLVLDQPISSKSSHAGDLVAAHLKEPLSIGGRVIAPAGSPAKIKIVAASPADIGDVYGFVDIFFEPLALPDGRMLPLRAPVARLEPHVSAGHESTVQWEDTIEDEVIPYHFLYHIFRKGKNFALDAGSEIPAHTEATITALPNGTIAIQTPHPLAPSLQMPKPTFPIAPVATPFGPAGETKSRKTPAPAATTTPTPWPTPEPPTPTPSPSPA